MGIFQNLTGWHALVILIVVVLLFGAAKLPALAKSVGQSMKIFKNEIKPEAKPETKVDADPIPADPATGAPQSSTPQSGSTETHFKP